MTRSIAALLLGVIAFAWQDYMQQLNSFVGQRLILRSFGNEQEVSVKRSDLNRPAGACDKAVEILKATQDKNKIVFRLEQIGDIRVGGASRCTRGWSQTTFTITDLGNVSPQVLTSELQDVFLTPEAYLARNGHAFNFQPSEELGPVTKPGGGVTAPNVVLNITPTFTEEARKNRIPDSRVALEIVVGPDGRIHSSNIVNGPGFGLNEQALRVLPLWRFQPARQGDKPVAVQVHVEFTFNMLR